MDLALTIDIATSRLLFLFDFKSLDLYFKDYDHQQAHNNNHTLLVDAIELHCFYYVFVNQWKDYHDQVRRLGEVLSTLCIKERL